MGLIAIDGGGESVWVSGAGYDNSFPMQVNEVTHIATNEGCWFGATGPRSVQKGPHRCGRRRRQHLGQCGCQALAAGHDGAHVGLHRQAQLLQGSAQHLRQLVLLQGAEQCLE